MPLGHHKYQQFYGTRTRDLLLLNERGFTAPKYTERQLWRPPQCNNVCDVSGIVNTGLPLVDRMNPLLWGYKSSRKVEWVSWVAPTYDHKEKKVDAVHASG